jgi:hypothetical protein
MNYTLILQALTTNHEQMAYLNRTHLQDDGADDPWSSSADPTDWWVDE